MNSANLEQTTYRTVGDFPRAAHFAVQNTVTMAKTSIPKLTNVPMSNPVATFQPMAWSMADIRRAIPAHLFERNTSLGFYYLTRDVVLAVALLFTVAKAEFFLDGYSVPDATLWTSSFSAAAIMITLARMVLWLT